MTERSLTREQVDRLLELIADGQLSLEEGPARPYPPREVELGPVQGVVERWIEEMARHMENWLIVNVCNDLSCSSGGLVARAGTIKSPPAALVLIGGGDQEALLTVWERPLVEAIIAGLLGYSFEAANPTVNHLRQLTEIDLRMLQRAAQGLSHAMAVGWPRGVDQVFQVLEVANDPGSLGNRSTENPSVACNLWVDMGPTRLGVIEFALPGWVGKELRSDDVTRGTMNETSSEMRETVGGLEVEFEVQVPVGEFTLRQILAMEKGDEIDLPTPLNARMEANGVACLEGEPGIIEGRWAVAVGPFVEGEEHVE